MPTSVVLATIQVGRRRTLPGCAGHVPLATAIFKTAVNGPVALGATGLEGDEQVNPIHHGGPDKAVCAYPGDHYPYWAEIFGEHPLAPGAFGENFTLAGLTERDACIGDVWTVGGAVIQITQPRQPCATLARRWRMPDLPKRVIAAGYTGWYFRVLVPGVVAPGAPLMLEGRTAPEWTIAAANDVMHAKPFDAHRAATLAAIEPLSAAWKETLQRRIEAVSRAGAP